MTLVYFILLSLLSGLLGRMGGAGKSGQWYENILDTKWRDIGCSIVAIVTLSLFVPFNISFWWLYLIILVCIGGAFSTYWDKLFGYDNMWFSGFVVGLAMIPAVFINYSPLLIILLILRPVFLCIVWGCLNKYLPKKVFIWNRAVAEEFLRYTASQ